MPEMTSATRANNFGPDHAMTGIFDLSDILGRKRLEKTRPASTGMKFGIRGKEGQLAACAEVDPLIFVVEQGAAKGRFCAGRPEDAIAGLTKVS